MTKPENPRGVELSSKQMKDGDVIVNKWDPRVKYAWATGEAISRFLEEMKNGKLIARKCDSCKRILFPPRMFCEECFKPTTEWVYIKDTGKIETYSISYLDKDARRITDPIFVGVVSIDGASEKMGIMHYFDETTKEDIRIGMPVKAVWKSPEEREGAITDIKYFRPLKEGEE